LINRRFHAAWAARGAAFDYSREAWAALVHETLQGVTPCAGDPAFFAVLYEHFAGPEPWQVYPDVRPALETLRRRGCRLAVLSNWDPRLRPLLQALKLADFFEALFISAEVGWHKPDPRLFAHAARRLGLRPDQMLHVGDSGTEDVGGARAAGWPVVWLTRDGAAPRHAAVPVVHSLTELVQNWAGLECPRTDPLSPCGPAAYT
jgi:putative hydrolase of the HAD superfamily